MGFTELLKNENIEETVQHKKPVKNKILEEEKKPQEILRGNGYKIKLVTPTSFGTQIDLAKKYNEDDLKDLLSGYSIKLKNNSIFVVN